MSKTILLADDSVTIRKVVELTFMEEDYQLVSLGGGEEALERLSEANLDLVIADIHMPGVSGYEVCRAAKEQRPERPVLLLVGTFEPFDAEELEASGADGHLKKPFDSQELLQTVRDLLAGGAADETAEVAAAAEEAGAAEDVAMVGGEPEEVLVVSAEDVGEIEEGAAAVEPVPDAEREAAVEAEPLEIEEREAVTADSTGSGGAELSDEAVERIARRVVDLLGPEAVRDVAWEVVPDLAEVVIKERLRELESQVE